MNRTSLLQALIVPALLGACGAGENTVGTDWPDAGNPPDTGNPSDSCNNCTPGAAKLVLSAPEACLAARTRAAMPSDSQSFEISNQGTGSSGALTVSLSGNEAFHFSLSNNTCTESTLAPGAHCSVVVSYDTPVVPAYAEHANLIVTDGVTSVQALIRGNDFGTVSASPVSLSFGQVAGGSTSTEIIVRVTTTSTCETKLTATIDNPNFVISSNTCTAGVTGACQIGVRFAPPEGANPSTSAGFLTITGSDSSSVIVTLTGVISPVHPTPAPLTASPALLDFAEFKVGESGTGIITVTGAKASPTAVISGSASFSIGANTCTAAGETCTLQIQFAPTATGASSATLYISDGINMATVVLQGKAVAASVAAPFTVTPTAVDFGLLRLPMSSDPVTISVTTPSARTFTATLSDSAATEVAIVENACSTLIPAGGTCIIRLVYTPTGKSVLDGALTLSDGTNVAIVTMVGVATTI